MSDTRVMEAFDARAERRSERRDFFKAALNVGGFVVAGAAASGIIASSAEAQAAITPNDVLNFALNLEYLEAQFYSYAAFGVGLDNTLLTGTRGTRGNVRTGTGPGMARQVPFADPIVAAYAREIAAGRDRACAVPAHRARHRCRVAARTRHLGRTGRRVSPRWRRRPASPASTLMAATSGFSMARSSSRMSASPPTRARPAP